MVLYLVTYDLISPGQNYSKLIKAIKSLDSWAHICESTWLIQYPGTSKQLRDYLWKFIDDNDVLFIIEANMDDWASLNVNKSVIAWLKR